METFPEGIDRGMVEVALDLAADRLTPCDPKTFAVLMKNLMTWATGFGVKTPDMAVITASYRAHIDLPADLMAVAVDRAMRDWKWGNRLPLPGELRGFVADELAERVLDQLRLRIARLKAPEQARDAICGQIERYAVKSAR